MDSLKHEFKQSVDPGSEPFTAIPRISWQAPIWAAAAVVIVSVAIMFGPGLFSGKPQSTSIARDVLDNLPSGRTGADRFDDSMLDKRPEVDFSGAEELGKLSESARNQDRSVKDVAARAAAPRDNLEAEPDKSLADEATNDPTESTTKRYARRVGAANEAGEDGADGVDKEAAEKAAENAKAAGEKKESSKDKEGDAWAGGGVGGGRAKTGKGEPQGGTPPPAEPMPRGNRDDGNSEPRDGGPDSPKNDADRELGGAVEDEKRKDQPAPPAPEAPGDSAATDDGAPGQSVTIEVNLTEGASLAAQTDVLWISKLYGDAKLDDADEDVESIEVELEADKLPELLEALRKLADDQGYGRIEGDKPVAALKENEEREKGQDAEVADAASPARRISGYLPADDERERQDQGLEPEGNGKIRVVIRLK